MVILPVLRLELCMEPHPANQLVIHSQHSMVPQLGLQQASNLEHQGSHDGAYLGTLLTLYLQHIVPKAICLPS